MSNKKDTTLGSHVVKIRSKNAGPFWFTVDVFCGDTNTFDCVSSRLTTSTVANALKLPAESVKRFDIESLSVVKFSAPRPVVQGSRFDRDMHGAQWAVLIAELPWLHDI